MTCAAPGRCCADFQLYGRVNRDDVALSVAGVTGIQQETPLHMRWRYRVGAGALYATGRRQPGLLAHELTGRSAWR